MQELVEIKKEEKYKLENLLQMYLHDISLYFPIVFNSNKGKYEYDDINKYFSDTEDCAYFLINDSNIVGFVLVDREESDFCVQEFFIMNNYKRTGLGKKFAYKIFDKYNSSWVIRVLPKSIPAEKFWEDTVSDYTNGNYEKELVGKYNRAVFRFGNK